MSEESMRAGEGPGALSLRLAGVIDPYGQEIRRFETLFRQYGLRTYSSKSSEGFLVGLREGDPALSVAMGDDGSVVVVDGYIYGGVRGSPTSAESADSVLRLLRERGVESFVDVDGDAAFIYWDGSRGELTLWRTDIPPVFYTKLGEAFVWSTGLRSLLLLGAPRDLDSLAIDAYLSTGWVPPPRTPLAHISKIPARSLASIRDGRVDVFPMWRPGFRPKERLSTRQRIDGLETQLRASVRARMAGHDRAAVLLSSGVDSSLIAALASKEDVEIEAYTYRYLDYEGPMNEGNLARELTEHLGIAHFEIPYSPSWLAEHLEELIVAHEVPFTYGLHSARLDPIRERGHEIVLTGMSADSWYPSQRAAWVHTAADYPSWLMNTIKRTTSPEFMSRIRLTRRVHTLATLATEPLATAWYELPVQTILSDEIRSELYSDPALADAGREAFIEVIEDCLRLVEGESHRDQDVFLTTSLFIPEHVLMWGYRWCSHAGLRLRVPFSGLDLTTYLARIERREGGKADLRRLAMRFMPRDIAYRPKFPQAIPIADWLRGPLSEILHSYLLDQKLDGVGVFDAGAIRKCLKDHVEGTSDHGSVLWTALCLSIWKDKFVDGTPAPLLSG